MENIADIVRGCIIKDHTCQRIVYEYYRSHALKIVFRYIYRYDKATDVVNDGFVKLFNNFHRFELDDAECPEKKFVGWLKKIMINVSIDYLRRVKPPPEIGGIPDNVWDVADNKYDADQIALYNDLILFIKELPADYRIVFNLYVIDGYSHSEIADIMNSTVGTSKSTLSRAKAMLQKRLRKIEQSTLCRI